MSLQQITVCFKSVSELAGICLMVWDLGVHERKERMREGENKRSKERKEKKMKIFEYLKVLYTGMVATTKKEAQQLLI